MDFGSPRVRSLTLPPFGGGEIENRYFPPPSPASVRRGRREQYSKFHTTHTPPHTTPPKKRKEKKTEQEKRKTKNENEKSPAHLGALEKRKRLIVAIVTLAPPSPSTDPGRPSGLIAVDLADAKGGEDGVVEGLGGWH